LSTAGNWYQLKEILDIVLINSVFFFSERKSDKMRLYNFDNVKKNRRWLRDVLISDTSDSSSDDGNDEQITEQDLQEMLRLHLLRKKYQARYYTNPEVKESVYFELQDLTNCLIFTEHKLVWFSLQ
jgi:DNA helicase INO80